ncbi:MAG: hypothetical protein U9N11_00940 [Campylobacterota bacterium]|nr:hypothetical protein [Campylobacterota bacterium]
MKVRIKEKDDTSSYLLDKEYSVLCVEISLLGEMKYRLIPEDYIYSCIEDVKKFEIIDKTLPSSWVMHAWKNGLYELIPEPWLKDNFWENFYDGNEKEIKIYFNEILKMFPNDKMLQEKIKKNYTNM